MDESTNTLYIFGGSTRAGPLNDLWSFSLDQYEWNQMSPTGDIPRSRYRFGYTKFMNQSNLKFAVFGGCLVSGESNEIFMYFTFRLHVAQNRWEKLVTNGTPPPALNGPTLQYYLNCIYLTGGEATSNQNSTIKNFADCYQLNLTTLTWKKLDISNNYQTRYLTGSALVGSNLILFDGWSTQYQKDTKDTKMLDLSNPKKWISLELSTLCSYMDSFAASVVNQSVYIFAGYTSISGNFWNPLRKVENNQCYLISDNYNSPTPRKYHSMVNIGEVLYIYGGQTNDGILDDIWSYSSTSNWTSILTSGDSPGARYGHAYDSQGDEMVIWGGLSISGYLNDLYIFNSLNSNWKLIKPVGDAPSPRIGACVIMQLPKIYIYGGSTASDILNDFWVFDISTKLYTSLPNYLNSTNLLVPSFYHSCTYYDNSIIVMMGIGKYYSQLNSVYTYNLNTGSWHDSYFYTSNVDLRSLACVKYINGMIIVIGGIDFSGQSFQNAFIINITDGTAVYTANFPNTFYAGTCSIIKSDLYLYGGGSLDGTTIRFSSPTYNFFSIKLSDLGSDAIAICGPGSYGVGSDCSLCKPGSYSDTYGADNCTLCPVATYSQKSGSNSVRKCYPCEEGTYSNTLGAILCLDCPAGSYCPIGSSNYNTSEIFSSHYSSQPAQYSSNVNTSTNLLIVYLTLSLAFGLFVILVVCFDSIRLYIHNIDIFKVQHNYTLDAPIIMKTNKIGAFFSFGFVLGSIIVIILSSYAYQYDNIQETKSLIPLVILEKMNQNIRSTFTIELEFYNYGDSCEHQFGPSGSFKSIISGISYKSYTQISYLFNKNCFIQLVCYDCLINIGASIAFYLQEKSSFCNAISLNMSSGSSIPLQTSSISETAPANSGFIFRGYTPTQFNVSTIGSLFESYVSDWNSPQTGYHVLIESEPVLGSQYQSLE